MSQTDWKTIKEIAEELDVSRETVRKQVANVPEKFVTRGANRQYLINPKGAEIIGLLINNEVAKTSSKQVANLGTDVVTDDSELVEVLRGQVSDLREQIKIKDKQIDDLTQSLRASQMLQMQHQQLLEADNKKVRWWQRFKK